MIYLRYRQVKKDMKEVSVWKCTEKISLNFTETWSDIIIVLSKISFSRMLRL